MSTWLDTLRERMKPPRRLSFTRGGKYFAGMTLLVGLGAINTGNNLLFLVLGMMLSLIVASGILSEAVLRKLRVRRQLPKRCFAHRTAPGEFLLDNPKIYPSLSVEVVEMTATCEVGPLAGREIGRSYYPWWRLWKSGTDDDSRAVGRGYTVRIDAGDEQRLDAVYRFPARGVFDLEGLSLTTRFPFSFFEKAREQSAPAEVVVYPSPEPPGDWAWSFFGTLGDVSADESGRGDEYFGLREYRPGEDKRLIHWKRSAARGELIIREQERESSRAVVIHLCNATGRSAAERHLVQPAFEEALRRVAGLIEQLSDRGWEIGLRTFDRRIPTTQGDTDALLRALATVELHDDLPDRPLTASDDEHEADVLVAFPRAANRLTGAWDEMLEIDFDPSEAGDEFPH